MDQLLQNFVNKVRLYKLMMNFIHYKGYYISLSYHHGSCCQI